MSNAVEILKECEAFLEGHFLLSSGRHSSAYCQMAYLQQYPDKCAAVMAPVAEKLKELGYQEVNLNLGCPSGTVTAKGKGSGFLAFPEELDRFLEEIFSRAPVAVSVKTRLGVREPEEFLRILEIYNRYPIPVSYTHLTLPTNSLV